MLLTAPHSSSGGGSLFFAREVCAVLLLGQSPRCYHDLVDLVMMPRNAGDTYRWCSSVCTYLRFTDQPSVADFRGTYTCFSCLRTPVAFLFFRWGVEQNSPAAQGGSNDACSIPLKRPSVKHQYGSTSNGGGRAGSSRDTGDRNQLTSWSAPCLATHAQHQKNKKSQQHHQVSELR